MLHCVTPHFGIRNRNLFGYRIALDCSDYIQRSIYVGCYEWEQTKTLRRYLNTRMTVVDAGANVGYYTLLAASLGCQVHAFEPSPDIFKHLKKTVESNRIPFISLVEAGLSDERTSARLPVPCPDMQTPSLLDQTASEYSTIKLMPLDDYLEANGIECVDLLKMDVEGFEPNIIRGSARSLSSGRIRAILCELSDYWLRCNESTPTAFYEEICDLGFEPSEKLGRVGDQTVLFKLR